MTIYNKTKECIGICPKCGSDNLNYETNVNDGDSLYYPFVCDNCGCEGREAYNLNYSETWYNA